MQLYNIYRLYVKKYNLSVQFLLTSAMRIFPDLLCQFAPVKQETDDFSILFCLIAQSLSVIAV